MSVPIHKRLGYDAVRLFCRVVGVAIFRFRCFGRDRMPKSGPVLVCANHQSTLDPVIVGSSFDRRLSFLARQTLFHFPPFRWVIEFFDAIPIDRAGMGISGLKECLRRLKRGEAVVIFPEGTRTRDGNVAPLQNGFLVLARRSTVVLLPVGLDGAYQAWPRTSWYPRIAKIRVVVGEPLDCEQIAQLDDQQLVEELERRMRECHRQARLSRLAVPPSPGTEPAGR